MRQVVQSLSGGSVRLVEVPKPLISPTEVLVETLASIVSSGTEKMITQLAQSSMLSKAKARPDLVKQVIQKAKQDGPMATLKTVKAKLNSDIPLGYSACGIVREVGEYVNGIQPGDLVATGGAGFANHADYQAVPGLLCVKVPRGVSVSNAAFSTIASIALHGLRLADIEPGMSVGIIGLGLIGQLAAKLAIAAGATVYGIDIDESKVNFLSNQSPNAFGYIETGGLTTEGIIDATKGRGVDCVLITAGGKVSLPLTRAPEIVRDRGTIVVVGDVLIKTDRTPLYNKELTLKVARSYGPGRYDRSYEDWGVDYPLGFVRFTEGRNMETILDLLAGNRITFQDLISKTFDIDSAERAYGDLSSSKELFGILFSYGKDIISDHPNISTGNIESVSYSQKSSLENHDPMAANRANPIQVGLIGAGSYTISTLIPKIVESQFGTIRGIVSSTGISANKVTEKYKGMKSYKHYKDLLDDSNINTVFVATPHSSHAEIVIEALQHKKHVWCEKPLALSRTDLEQIYNAISNTVLFVGFNRRFSPSIQLLRRHFSTTDNSSNASTVIDGGRLTITYRVAAGRVPLTHWYHDRREGGRLMGEVCHFIDTCSAIVGLPVSSISVMGSGYGERILAEDLALLLKFDDGSLATITYSVNGHSSTGKERIEVLGRGKTAVIDDFRSIELDGKKETLKSQDKGQLNAIMEFDKLIKANRTSPDWVYESTLATIIAAEQLTIV